MADSNLQKLTASFVNRADTANEEALSAAGGPAGPTNPSEARGTLLSDLRLMRPAAEAFGQTPVSTPASLPEVSSPKSPPTPAARTAASAEVFATRRIPALQATASIRSGQGLMMNSAAEFLPPLHHHPDITSLPNARRDLRQMVNAQAPSSSPSESRQTTQSSLPDRMSFMSMGAGAGGAASALGADSKSETRQQHQLSLDSMLSASLQSCTWPTQTSLPDRIGNAMAAGGSRMESKSRSHPGSTWPTQTSLPDRFINNMGTPVTGSGASPCVTTKPDSRSSLLSRWPTHTSLPGVGCTTPAGAEGKVDFRQPSHVSLDALMATANAGQAVEQAPPQPAMFGSQPTEFVGRRRSEPALGSSSRHHNNSGADDFVDRNLTSRVMRAPSEAMQTLAGDIFGCFANGRALPANLDAQARSGGLRSWQSPLDGTGQLDHELSKYSVQQCASPSSHEARQHPRQVQFRQAFTPPPSNIQGLDASLDSPDAGAGFATERSTNHLLSLPTMLGSRGPEEGASGPSGRRISDVTVSSGRPSVVESSNAQTITDSSISICAPSVTSEVYFDVSESTQDESSSTSRRASINSAVPTRRTSFASTVSQAQTYSNSYNLMSQTATEDGIKRNSSQTPRSSITIFELHRQVANALSEGDFEEVRSSSCVYVGLPCLDRTFPVQQWGSSGEQFHALKVYLQAMGIFTVAPAYVPTFSDPCTARAFHYASLVFILIWHLALWGCFLWMALKFFTLGSNNALLLPSFFQVVQVVLLFVAIPAHALCVYLCLGRTICVMLEIASRWSFVRCWERKVYRSALGLFIFDVVLSGSAVFAGKALVNMDQRADSTYVATMGVLAAASWTLLLTLYLLLLMVVQFCSLGLDAFALDLLNAPGSSGLGGLVGQFNVLLAGIRRAAYAVQCGLAVFVGLTLVLAIAALCLIALPALPLGRVAVWGDVPGGTCSGKCDGTGDVIVVAWVTALLFLGLRLLNHIAIVNLKCKRLPALVHSLDFGQEIDHDRWCVAAHIAASEPGFPVHSVLITRGAVLKIGYISLAGLCLLITRLLVYHGDQDE